MTGISITPLGETIGARVEGLDLSAALSLEVRAAVWFELPCFVALRTMRAG